MSSKRAVVGSLAGMGLVGTYALLRRARLRWGASAEEVATAMAGDDIVSNPQLTATRAIDIAAPRALVWPWLVQMGYGRAGWYSHDLVDNDGHRSAEQIIAKLQGLKQGDVVPTGPDGGFVVERLEPERLLVLTMRRPYATSSVVIRLDENGPYQTRLLIRLRLRVRSTPRGLGFRMLVEAGDFVLVRRMMLGIKRRAETANAERAYQFDLADAPEA